MIHPGKKLIEEIRNRNRTQKQFAVFVGKKNSEVNELIKGKRNITIQWDLILSEIFGTPEKYWINMQTDYDYEIAKKEREKQKMEQKQDFEVVTDIEKPETVEVQPSNEVESGNVEENEESQNIVASLPEKQEEAEISQELQNENEVPHENHEDSEKQQHREMQKIFLSF